MFTILSTSISWKPIKRLCNIQQVMKLNTLWRFWYRKVCIVNGPMYNWKPQINLNPSIHVSILELIGQAITFLKSTLMVVTTSLMTSQLTYSKSSIHTKRLQPCVNLYNAQINHTSTKITSQYLVFCVWIKGFSYSTMLNKMHFLILNMCSHRWSSYLWILV